MIGEGRSGGECVRGQMKRGRRVGLVGEDVAKVREWMEGIQQS